MHTRTPTRTPTARRARAGRRRGIVCTHDARGVAYYHTRDQAAAACMQLRAVWPDAYTTRTARGFMLRRLGSSDAWTGSRWITADAITD